MPGITETLAEHHRLCDLRLERVDDAAGARDWNALPARIAELRLALERHFGFEEETLFPAFERTTGASDGPTAAMRSEHEHMRNLLSSLAAASPGHDPTGWRAELDALHMMLQQHNAREEGVLYPACDRLPAQVTAGLAEEARALLAAEAGEALDLRDLEPPAPLLKILERLEAAPGTPLRVRLRREPLPLYEALAERGFRHHATAHEDGSVTVLIER